MTSDEQLTVTSAFATAALKKIFQTYPSYKEYAHKNKIFQVWVSQLENLLCVDLDAVVGEIVKGDREPTGRYEKAERLALNIVEECRLRAGRRRLKEEQEAKYHNPSRGAFSFVRNTQIGHMAIDLGAQVQAGKITREQSHDRCSELLAWEKGQVPKPLWLDA